MAAKSEVEKLISAAETGAGAVEYSAPEGSDLRHLRLVSDLMQALQMADDLRLDVVGAHISQALDLLREKAHLR